MVTLKGPDGNVFTVHCGDQVKNLAQVKKGDLVQVTYYESLAYEVKKPDRGCQASPSPRMWLAPSRGRSQPRSVPARSW